MNRYKIILHSGAPLTVEDNRDLGSLSATLCTDGYIVVRQLGSGYSSSVQDVSILERAVARIEVLLQQ